MKTELVTFLTLLALSGSPSAAPQVSVGGGPFSALANGISLGTGSGPDHLRIKAVGDQSVFPPPAQPPPSPLTVQAVPDYSYAAMFGAWGVDAVEIDALSTGNDLVFLHLDGRIDLNNRWVALPLTLTHDSPVNDPGNPIHGQAEPGAHLLTHVVAGSAGIFAGLGGLTMLAQDPTAMGFGSAEEAPEIDAMDFAVPLLSMNQGSSGSVLLVNGLELFFSVTRASAGALPASFFGGAPASGATILKIAWEQDPLGNWGWSDPQPVAVPSELRLSAGDEVDALGINAMTGSLIFSTERRPGSTLAQLRTLVRDPQGGAHVNDLKYPGGGAVGPKLKLTIEDDIDSICGLDPEPGAYSYWLGTPADHGPPANSLSLSLAAGRDPASFLDSVVLQVSGWGSATPSDGIVFVEAGLFDPSAPFGPTNPQFTLLDTFPRSMSEERIERTYSYIAPDPLGIHVGVRARFRGAEEVATSWISILRR